MRIISATLATFFLFASSACDDDNKGSETGRESASADEDSGHTGGTGGDIETDSGVDTSTNTAGEAGIAGDSQTNDTAGNTQESFMVGGEVNGLASGNTVTLRINDDEDVALDENGAYDFPTPIADGTEYDVAVKTQPTSPNQTCIVENHNGTVEGEDVADVDVSCTTDTYSISGTVSGLASGNEVILRINDAEDVTISENGDFTFDTALEDGSEYDVEVKTQPTSPSQTCSVENYDGTVEGENITNIYLSCSTNTYTVGGTVSGLIGSGLALQINGADELSISDNGSFAFDNELLDGTEYTVTVLSLPSSPYQTCTVSNPSGALSGANIENVNVTCTRNPSCFEEAAEAGNSCGPDGDEDCCASPRVTGGTFYRSFEDGEDDPATVSDFRLDRFEVTVGRFRAFVQAGKGTQDDPPAEGDGEHPFNVDSGWDANWNVELEADSSALSTALQCNEYYQTFTESAGANEYLPINCITWYEAMAFCAWDGGWLPTEAQWGYAAAGGDEQRYYPWSNPANDTTIDDSYAVYDCMADGSSAGECAFGDIFSVGSRSPKGDGRWGQADLSGSMNETVLDGYGTYSNPCDDCIIYPSSVSRVIRGGGFVNDFSELATFRRVPSENVLRSVNVGFRCARSPL